MPKSKKELKKLKSGLRRLKGYEGIVKGAAKPALWVGYASAVNAVESIVNEVKASKKVQKRRKKAIKAIAKLAEQAGGKKALRVGKTSAKIRTKKRKASDEDRRSTTEARSTDRATIERLIGTPDASSNVVPLSTSLEKNRKAQENTKLPGALKSPLDGIGDNLQLIAGVGPKLEEVLHGLGIWHYEQIANWGNDEIARVDEHLRFSGRVEREQWVAQASALSRGGREEYNRIFGKDPR